MLLVLVGTLRISGLIDLKAFGGVMRSSLGAIGDICPDLWPLWDVVMRLFDTWRSRCWDLSGVLGRLISGAGGDLALSQALAALLGIFSLELSSRPLSGLGATLGRLWVRSHFEIEF